jgi:hypothetical protein
LAPGQPQIAPIAHVLVADAPALVDEGAGQAITAT